MKYVQSKDGSVNDIIWGHTYIPALNTIRECQVDLSDTYKYERYTGRLVADKLELCVKALLAQRE